MKNKTLQSIDTNGDFTYFINSRFKNPVQNFKFPPEYENRRPPKSLLQDFENPEVKNIVERELIRDNIYTKYRFDIYEFPFVVFYENDRTEEKMKPFKLMHEAQDFCKNLLNKGTFSLLINIMNREIDCRIFKNETSDELWNVK